jgi:hypothetical protein
MVIWLWLLQDEKSKWLDAAVKASRDGNPQSELDIRQWAPIQFLVMPVLSGSAILDMDVLRNLSTQLSLDDNTLAVSYLNDSGCVQSQELAIDQLEEYSDDDDAPLIATVQAAELSSAGLPPDLSDNSSRANGFCAVDPITAKQEEAVTSLLREYDDLFVTDLTETSGINCASFSIKLRDPTVMPVSSPLRRYSPGEKNMIKKEIEEMLKMAQ